MTPTEQSMIASLFERIRSTPMPSRDGEAERLIASEMARTPGAAYALAQTVLVQDQALKLAAEEARFLTEAAKGHAPAEPAGSLLSRVGLGGVRPGAVPRTGRQTVPEEGREAAPSSGGFLAGALQTTAGVAGGALLFEGVKSLFGASSGPSSASSGASEQASQDTSQDKVDDRDDPDEDRLREASYDEDDAEDGDDDGDDDWSDGGFDGDDLI